MWNWFKANNTGNIIFLYHVPPNKGGKLTHLFPMHHFSTPWKHQKALRFTLVSREFLLTELLPFEYAPKSQLSLYKNPVYLTHQNNFFSKTL